MRVNGPWTGMLHWGSRSDKFHPYNHPYNHPLYPLWCLWYFKGHWTSQLLPISPAPPALHHYCPHRVLLRLSPRSPSWCCCWTSPGQCKLPPDPHPSVSLLLLGINDGCVIASVPALVHWGCHVMSQALLCLTAPNMAIISRYRFSFVRRLWSQGPWQCWGSENLHLHTPFPYHSFLYFLLFVFFHRILVQVGHSKKK